MAVLQNAVRVLAAGCACTFLMGCEIDNTKDHEDEPAETSSTANTSDTTDTTTTATTPAAAPVAPTAPGSIPAGGSVSGDPSEGNGETENIGNSAFWVDGSSSMGIHCLANDHKSNGRPPEYNIDHLVAAQGALKMYVWPDKSVIAVASDFVSPRSGLVYKFKGFVPKSAGNGLITENPHILSSDQASGTFRVYWNTHSAQ